MRRFIGLLVAAGVCLGVGCDGASGTLGGGEPGSADAGPGGTRDSSSPQTGTDAGSPDPAPDAGEALDPDAGSALGDDAGPGPAGDPPAAQLDDVHLYLNLGDSIGAGYDASSSHGYSRMFFQNDDGARPTYAGHDLSSRWPGATRADQAQSGFTTGDALSRLRGRIDSLPLGGDGDDTVVTISAGGNDFNDDLMTILVRARTEAAAMQARANHAEMVRLLRARYDDPARGRVLVVLATNVGDPTGGTGRVPATTRDGFCSTLQSPLLTDSLRATAISNLVYFDEQLAAQYAADGAWLVDWHGVMLAHGENASGAERWMSGDCAHPNDQGHHELRREAWRVLTGESF